MVVLADELSDNTVTFSQNLTCIMAHRLAITMPSLVGLIPCPFQPNPEWNRGLPGIDYDRTDSYVPLFFGASREYGPDEGWQTVRRRKGRRGPAFRSKQSNPGRSLIQTASHTHSNSPMS